MLVHYSYMTFEQKEYGEFTVDIEDFRKFCKSRLHKFNGHKHSSKDGRHYSRSNVQLDVAALYVIFGDGRAFIWNAYDKYGYGGWQDVTLAYQHSSPYKSDEH